MFELGTKPRCFKHYFSLFWLDIIAWYRWYLHCTKRTLRSETNCLAESCGWKDAVCALPLRRAESSCSWPVPSNCLHQDCFWRDAKVATFRELCCEGRPIRWEKGETECGILVSQKRPQAVLRDYCNYFKGKESTQRFIMFWFFSQRNTAGSEFKDPLHYQSLFLKEILDIAMPVQSWKDTLNWD